MKKYLLIASCILQLAACMPRHVISNEKVSVIYDNEKRCVNVKTGDSHLLSGIYGSYKWNNQIIYTSDYKECHVSIRDVDDIFGKGKSLILTYHDECLPHLKQFFYIYDDKDYILTELLLSVPSDSISSNYMAPLNITAPLTYSADYDNRILLIPFDNDCFVRYQSHPLGEDTVRSYEATSIFNNQTRNGIVIGSIEHSDWKTGIDIYGLSPNEISSITCFGGVADKQTRDSKPHGYLKGTTIKSPKIFIGFFDDWRDGMESYAIANTIVTPSKKWNQAMPFGWNSWGTLQFNLNYQNAKEVSDYFHAHLQNQHFLNADSSVCIGLDSGWNKMTEEELKDFVDHCKRNGQMAGIYWAPFADWAKRPQRTVQDSPSYTYAELYLYANGQPQELDEAYALDPTHPAIEARMQKMSDLFHRCGFNYVKIDFLSHAMMEADSWYNKKITTGAQAYNYAMRLINHYFGDMYINLSIAPIFPFQYAHSRRIACDAWNKIEHTEYTMNALSYGWWLNKLYQYNDPDHIVLRDATESENRARVTSGVITGLYIAGDDFSANGDPGVKRRAETFLTNPEVNAVATGLSFRPVEGHGHLSERQFVRYESDGSIHYAVFNYGTEPVMEPIPFSRLGIPNPKDYSCKDLWEGTCQSAISSETLITIPPKDVRLLKLEIKR